MQQSAQPFKRPHLVIVGGGFGGMSAAHALRHAAIDITLIDRRNHHLFQPLLYQVATGALNPADIAYPIRRALRAQKNVRVLLAEACGVDRDRRVVVLDNGELAYDFLIIATGATHSYFGNDGWAEHAPGLKSVEDALDIRRRIYLAYEAAARETDPAAQAAWLTFVVVGAGPTGVELAGALAEIGRHTLTEDFRDVDTRRVRVVLVEGLDRVLNGYPEELSEKAKRQLQSLGVEVRLGSFVSGIDERGVDVGDERIEARTVLWAAGVRASSLARTLDAPLDKAGRVEVEPDLSVPGHPEIFVIGDLAAFRQDGAQLPGVAQVAIQGGRHTAKNIQALASGEPTAPFRYRDKGSLATIGRSRAVALVGRLKMAGLFAWLFWWVVHILFLIGFRNRVLVMFSWAWQYLTYQRGSRLITGEVEGLPPVHARSLPPALQDEDEVSRHVA